MISADQITGYAHRAYAAALDEIGLPVALPRSGGWLLERDVPGGMRDATGAYPVFACADWTALRSDIDTLAAGLISVVLVSDPFGNYDEPLLRRTFTDVVRPYKQHFVTDLRRASDSYVASHHRRNARKALLDHQIEIRTEPSAWLADWIRLYAELVARHEIRTVAAFSARSFERQLAVPGIVALRATRADQLAGMMLWYVSGSVAYYHLGASSQLGYETRSAFALVARSIEYFAAAGLSWLDLGAAPDTGQRGEGLTRFKRGWSTGERTAWLCGSILDRERYAQLTNVKRASDTSFFPAYRAPHDA